MKRILRFLADNFITGIVVILPITVTIFILRFITIKLNQVLLNPLLEHLQLYLAEEYPRVILAKGIIFISVIFVLIIIGLATRIFIIRKTFSFFEKALYRLPMVNKIYSVTKEISSAFLGKHKGAFTRVILLEYPRKGIYSIGFVTTESSPLLREKVDRNLICVYIPTTPNPTSGIFLLIPEEEAIPLDITVEEGLKTVISSGVILPKR